jgi:hypothetical protein
MNSTHRIYLWEVSTQQLIATADVRPTSLLENGFRVAELGVAVTLKAGEKYRIVSSETTGGDLWFNVDQQGALTVSNHARITTSVSTATDANATYPESIRDMGENKGFVGVTFFYQLINDTEPNEPEPEVPDVAAKMLDLISKYKAHQGFADADSSFDEVIRFNIESAIKYIVKAGVSMEQVNGGEADFAIIRGASDMWDGDRFSRIFMMSVTQLR